jgi:hypothetical protein
MLSLLVISLITTVDGDISTFAHQALAGDSNPAADNYVAAWPAGDQNYALVKFTGLDLSPLETAQHTYVFPDAPLDSLLSEVPLIQRDDLFQALHSHNLSTEAISIGSDSLREVVDLVRRSIDPGFDLSNFG